MNNLNKDLKTHKLICMVWISIFMIRVNQICDSNKDHRTKIQNLLSDIDSSQATSLFESNLCDLSYASLWLESNSKKENFIFQNHL